MLSVQIRNKFYRGVNGWTVSWVARGTGVRSKVFTPKRTVAEMIRAIARAEDAGELDHDRASTAITACLYADKHY